MDNSTILRPSLNAKIESLLARYPVVLQLFRFVGIGVINYVIDTIIFNLLSKYLGISAGGQLGLVNVPGFIVAVIQSYIWNHYWTFGSSAGLVKNFVRLFVMGLFGGTSLLLILLGAKLSAQPLFYLVLLASFVVVEIILWSAFGLRRDVHQSFSEKEFLIFMVVSTFGLLINSFLLAVLSTYLIKNFAQPGTEDLLKNAAKILATVVSLVWNFIGYKLLVFKR